MSAPDVRGPRAALIAGWLRRARAEASTAPWVLRGSLVTAALCPDARPPADVDYLLAPTAEGFDPVAIAETVNATVARADPTTSLTLVDTEVIFAETASPGVRARLDGTVGDGPRETLTLDLAVGDPMAVPPITLELREVGAVRGCAPETLFGWKLHGLCEHGPGRWRAKDLFDLELLWRQAALDRDGARAAIALAFSSRGLPLSALDDFRSRPDWGQSRGGRRKWRALCESHPPVGTFDVVRERVRGAVDELLGPLTETADRRR